MPASKKIVRPPRPAAPFSPLLLRCRFDFPSRSWSLPTFDDSRQVTAIFRFFSREIFFGDSVGQPPFSDPAKGGSDHPKPQAGRIGIRTSRLLVKVKTAKKNEN
jgi:hypothetical protein